ncbi:TIGR03086 family metal-binding protein [Streptomyces griseosporeus]|uniref:TIGR03086 family metal-binding protein n=1 Tax=Streptomyces griseosporeus TaxID=1910 RepID=UPI00198D7556|nr:TIGR03086 family metal-binding protein [Streptomyces griseosporeus]GHF37326.1 TIGR03086 family protein [Streptomyces griseosporeus]
MPSLDSIRASDARAVRDSVAVVRRVTPDDLTRPTPCAAWNLGGLLEHMTVQHRGFAAAARGAGADIALWKPEQPGPGTIRRYLTAADEVIEAFAEVTAADQEFTLPEFGTDAVFPAVRAIGFHFIDYVVHAWDVARALGDPFAPSPDLLDAALPLALAVPDGTNRRRPNAAFAPAQPHSTLRDPLARILLHLGRSPSWAPPAKYASAGG